MFYLRSILTIKSNTKKIFSKNIKTMELKSLENLISASLVDAKEHQAKHSTKEMAMIITYLENAEDKIRRLKNKKQ